MATARGLEPPTSGVTGRHSTQLSYAAIMAKGRVFTFEICRSLQEPRFGYPAHAHFAGPSGKGEVIRTPVNGFGDRHSAN